MLRMLENFLILSEQSGVLHKVLGFLPMFLIHLDLRHSDTWNICEIAVGSDSVPTGGRMQGQLVPLQVITDVLRRQKGSLERTVSRFSCSHNRELTNAISLREQCDVK